MATAAVAPVLKPAAMTAAVRANKRDLFIVEYPSFQELLCECGSCIAICKREPSDKVDARSGSAVMVVVPSGAAQLRLVHGSWAAMRIDVDRKPTECQRVMIFDWPSPRLALTWQRWP